MFEIEKNLKLSDLVDMDFLQEIQGFFAKTLDIACISVDNNGEITKPSNFTDFCTQFVRGNKLSLKNSIDLHIKWGKASAKKREPIIYTCPNGLTEIAVPIFVAEKHMGSIIGGQVFLEPPNEDYYRESARKLGVDENEYIRDLRKIKVVPVEKVEEAAHLMSLVAGEISRTANIKFELSKTSERESLYRIITEKIRSSLDLEETLAFICEETAKLFNVQRSAISVFGNPEKFEEYTVRKEYKSSPDIKGFLKRGDFPKVAAYWRHNIAKVGKVLAIDNIKESTASDCIKNIYESMGVKSVIGISIQKGDVFWGTLILADHSNYRHWTEEDKTLLGAIASQVYIAINQAELFEEAKQAAVRENVLRSIVDSIRKTLDIDEVLTNICDEIGKSFNSGRISLLKYNLNLDRRYEIKKEYKLKPEYITITDVGISEEIRLFWNEKFIAQKLPYLLIEKISESELPESIKNTYDKMGIKTLLGIAIKKEDDLWGGIWLSEYDYYRIWTEKDIHFLQIIADQTYLAIKNAELFEQQKQTAERETLLRKIIEAIRSSIDLDKTLTIICDEIAKLFKVQRATIVEFYDKNDLTLWKAVREYKERENIIGLNDLPYDKRAGAFTAQWVMQDAKNLVIDNVAESDAPDYFKESYIVRGVKSLLSVPIRSGEDKFGIIFLSSIDDYRQWSKEEIQLLESTASEIHVAIRHAELFEKQKKTAEREMLLRKIIETLRSSLDINEVKKNITYEIGKAFNADRCYFRSFDKLKDEFLPSDVEYLVSDDVKSFLDVEPDQLALKYFSEEVLKQNKGFYPIVVDEEFVKNTPLEAYFKKFEIKVDYAIPIVDRGGETIWLVLHYSKVDPKLSEDYKKLLETIAFQIDITFSQIKLYNAIKQTAERERLAREITAAISSTLDINEIRKMLVNNLGRALGADLGVLYLQDPLTNRFVIVDEFSVYLSSDEIESPVGVNILEDYGWGDFSRNEKLSEFIYSNVEDLKKDYNLYGTKLEEFLDRYKIKSTIFIVIWHSNVALGVLAMNFIKEYKTITQEDVRLMKTVGAQAGIALHQAELYKNEKRTAEREILLRKIFENMRSSLDIKTVKMNMVYEVGNALNADRCFVAAYEADEDSFSIDKYSEYLSSTEVKSFIGYNPQDLNVKWFMEAFKNNKEISFVNSAEFISKNNLQGTPEEELLINYNIKSSYSVLILYADSLLGYLSVQYTKDYTQLDEKDLEFLRIIATQAGIALRQAKLYKITQVQAEREKFNKNLIEILRSTMDKNTIKHLFVQNIGKYFNADRVLFSDFDPESKMYLPVDKFSEYLSGPDVKSFVGYDWSSPSSREYIQPLLEKREFKIPCWPDYIRENQKSEGFVDLFVDANVSSSYNFPVFYQQNMIGYFCIEFTRNRCNILSNEDINSIRSICAQAGIALYHSELFVQARESARSKVEFIANISNELKSPLNNLIEFSDILSNSEFDCKKQVEYLNNINQSSKELLDLRNDIVIIAAIESENFKLNYENIDSEKLIMEVVSSVKVAADDKCVVVDTILSNVEVKADKKMLAQILYNLLNNAIKLTQENSNIKIKSNLDGNKLAISLEIIGLGVSPDNQNMVFEKFKQIDSSYPRRQQGVGLELSIATKLIELHNGSVSVDSTSDNGTMVMFSLPNAKQTK